MLALLGLCRLNVWMIERIRLDCFRSKATFICQSVHQRLIFKTSSKRNFEYFNSSCWKYSFKPKQCIHNLWMKRIKISDGWDNNGRSLFLLCLSVCLSPSLYQSIYLSIFYYKHRCLGIKIFKKLFYFLLRHHYGFLFNNKSEVKLDRPTNLPTDQPSIHPTNRRTDRKGHREISFLLL